MKERTEPKAEGIKLITLDFELYSASRTWSIFCHFENKNK